MVQWMKIEVEIVVPIIFLVQIQIDHPLATDLVLRVLVDVPEEDGAVESRGGEDLLPSRVLYVLHPVHVAVQGPHLVLQVPEVRQFVSNWNNLIIKIRNA